MTKRKEFWITLMAGSIAAWVYIIAGFFVYYENCFLYYLWLILLPIWCIVHPLELFITIPMKDRLKTSSLMIVINTLLFGFTWWLSKKKGYLD